MGTLRDGQGTMAALSGWGKDQWYIEGDKIIAEGMIFTLPHGDGSKGRHSTLPSLCSRTHGNMTMQCHGKCTKEAIHRRKKECLCVNTVTMFKITPSYLAKNSFLDVTEFIKVTGYTVNINT